MTTSWPTTPPADPTTGPSYNQGTPPSGRPSLFVIIITAVAVLATLGAIVLAVFAPSFEPASPTAPSNFSKLYDADLNANATGWGTSQSGCDLGSQGLHAVGDPQAVECPFTLTASRDLLRNGFLVQVTVAPDTALQTTEQPVIALGDWGYFAVESVGGSGEYVLCDNTCESGDVSPQVISSDSWHAAGFSSQTITLSWPGPGSQLSVYVNGQLVTTTDFSFSGPRQLRLGAPKNGEALYTHMTLYTPS